MSSIHSESDSEERTQFLVKVFYRTGSYPRHLTHSFTFRPEDIHSRYPPPYVSIYADQDSTLSDLAALLSANASPSPLPSPAGGTRLSFQLVFPDIRNAQQHRYMTKDLGSVVVGDFGPGDAPDDQALAKLRNDADRDGRKTLGQARFVVGDCVSCAILPPLEDGSVAPGVPTRRESKPSAWDAGRPGRDIRGGGGGGFGGAPSFPTGEWRRGERLPNAPRPRGGGRWR
ncbi:hypothetical protein jhhlp_001917 [Lomentospora prolificans]|uniref:Sin3 associated polypeptide p18 n=1 Tax=Lomentospora prolificans TaxID=41688 RepID=A0A2N3NCN8_9PEZI|nr:hypothetical protein jhhlp_001917 [Lomentospora prolificans]